MIEFKTIDHWLYERDFFNGRGAEFDGEWGSYKINDFDVKAFLYWEEFGNTFSSAKSYVQKWKSLSSKNYEVIRSSVLEDLYEYDEDIVDIKYPKFHAKESNEEQGLAISFKIYSADEETLQQKDFKSFGDNRTRKNYSHRGLF